VKHERRLTVGGCGRRLDGATLKRTLHGSTLKRTPHGRTLQRTLRAADERTTVQKQSQRDMSIGCIVRLPKNGSFQGRVAVDAPGNSQGSQDS
jgi:hypothetical protein